MANNTTKTSDLSAIEVMTTLELAMAWRFAHPDSAYCAEIEKEMNLRDAALEVARALHKFVRAAHPSADNV